MNLGFIGKIVLGTLQLGFFCALKYIFNQTVEADSNFLGRLIMSSVRKFVCGITNLFTSVFTSGVQEDDAYEEQVA
jgi:hypothetical protein